MNYKHQQKSQKTSIEEYLSSKYADLQPPTSLKIPLPQDIYHAAGHFLYRISIAENSDRSMTIKQKLMNITVESETKN